MAFKGFSNMFQKIIASILIIGLILSLGLNLFLVKPKEAKALDGGGGWAQAIKDAVLDAIGWVLTDMVLKRLEAKIIAWGQGRKSDEMKPFPVADWLEYFQYALAIGAAKFIADFDAIWDLRDAFHQEMRDALDSLGFSTYNQDMPPYSIYARPTLREDLEIFGVSYNDFINSGYSLRTGGWAGWFSLTKPQNNIFGQALMAGMERRRQELAQKEAADKETAVSHGVRNEETTNQTDTEKCEEHCYEMYGSEELWDSRARDECLRICNTKMGVPLETTVKNWGTTIEKYMTDALGKDSRRIISADEITELIGVLFSALMTKAINGLGVAFNSLTANQSQRDRAENRQYGYQRDFQQDQTLQDRQDIRSTILSGLLKAIQQLSRSIISCEKDEMMTEEDYGKNLADILESNVEALYVGMTGVNLKPDFVVLDPRFAPYSVYGWSWGHVPATKIPSKCRKILEQEPLNLGSNSTCRSIQSGLEPNYNSECERCLYDHGVLTCPPAPYPPQPYSTTGGPWTTSLLDQKSNFYTECKKQYNAARNRCEVCITKVDEKCDQIDEKQKNQCILNHCTNYVGISDKVVSPPVDGLDFYNKCRIEEQKEACYVCLKEYFVPAGYCEETKDYVARSIIKYPTVVKIPRSWLVGDEATWIGPKDETMAAMGGMCANNYRSHDISVDLVCRIMPDFKHRGIAVCRSRCPLNPATGYGEEQLRDITDFRPNGIDCNSSKLDIGGREPWETIKDGLLQIRGKCCAEAWQGDSSKYAACTGAGSTEPLECTWGKPIYKEPWCLCNEGWRPMGYVDNRGKRPKTYFACNKDLNQPGVCPDPDSSICNPACGSDSFTVPNMANINAVQLFSNAAPGGSVMFVATGNCNDPDHANCLPSSGAMLERQNNFAQLILGGFNKLFKLITPCASAQATQCIGSATPCGDFSGDNPGCTNQLGCHYVSRDDSCLGTVRDCADIITVTRCNLQDGCEWSDEPPPINGPPSGSCDYVAKVGGIICEKETQNARASKGCCVSRGSGATGKQTFTCDLSGRKGDNVNYGVFNNQAGDCSTSIHVCIKCDHNDDGYPTYGYPQDQCNGKI